MFFLFYLFTQYRPLDVDISPLPHIDVFWRIFDPSLFSEASNSGKNSLFRPQTLFFVWEMLLKMWSLFRRRPYQKSYIRGCQKGDVPFCFGGLKGAAAHLIEKKFGHVTGKKWTHVDCKVMCNERWKAFYSIHWEVVALWNQFWCTFNRRLFNENRPYPQNAHEVKG
jgi:hypothetical protein